MAELVVSPLDVDGNAMTAQVVEFIGGITLGAIHSLGEAMDRCAMDENNTVFYDAIEVLQGTNSTAPDPVGASSEEPTQATGGEAEEPCGLCCSADGPLEQQEHAVCEDLPNSLCDTEPQMQLHSQEQEEAERSPSDDQQGESSPAPESAESRQLLLGAETEMLGQPQPQSCEPVSSGNDRSGESLISKVAESTQPERESETMSETEFEDDSESRCPESKESTEFSNAKIQKDSCAQLLVAEEELPQDKYTSEESFDEHIQSTCIESGESLKYCYDTPESAQNVKSENDTFVQSVCTESGETIQHLCNHKPSEAPLCQANEELVQSLCRENGQSTLSGSISDSEGLEPSLTQEGQSVCETPTQQVNTASLHAAATSSMDVCDRSASNQQETEETMMMVPGEGACPVELPGPDQLEGSGQQDNSFSLPGAPGGLCSEIETDGAKAMPVGTATTITSNSNMTGQQDTETVVPDDRECSTKFPCEAMALPDKSQSLPEGPCRHSVIESAVAAPVTAAASSTGVCDTSPSNLQETEDTTAPDDGASHAELPACLALREVSAQPDHSISLPEVASCPDPQLEIEIAAAAAVASTVATTATSSIDICKTSPSNQLETEETVVPDDRAHLAELPGERDNVTTEEELSGSFGELHSISTELQRLISKETQTEILEEATAMSQIQLQQQEKTEQDKATAVEAVQDEQAEGVTGGSEAAESAPTPSVAGEDDGPNAGLESSGDMSSGDDLAAEIQDETLDGSRKAGAQQTRKSGSRSSSGSPPSRGTASLDRRKKPPHHHSFNKSKYSTVSYRRIRRGNTRQRIDEFEAMMNM